MFYNLSKDNMNSHSHHGEFRHHMRYFARHVFELSGRHHAHRGGRHHHGGFGHFGDDNGDGLTRGRKFTSDDLQLLLLALLAEKPAHGYELIKSLETVSNGFYVPSPGMVYPALTYLEELGYVSVLQSGNRKCYTLAEEGRSYLATNQERADLMLGKLRQIARKMDSVRRAFSGEAGAPGADASAEALPELLDARRALKSALHGLSGAAPEEQRRVAGILEAATRQIQGDL